MILLIYPPAPSVCSKKLNFGKGTVFILIHLEHSNLLLKFTYLICCDIVLLCSIQPPGHFALLVHFVS